MASIRVRHNKDGSTSHVVLFRHQGKQTSVPFLDPKAAETFRAAATLNADMAVAMLNQKQAGRTVDSLFVEWLELKQSDMTVEAHRDYERQYAKWIKPTFGWRDAELITEKEVQAWVDKTLKPKLAPKSVAKNHALLHGMFKWASSRTVGLIENDPCTETKLPRKVKRPPRGMTIAELQWLLGAAQTVEQRATADVVAVAAGTGWRPGEVLGLLVGGVEIDLRGHVYVTMLSVYRRGEGIVAGGKTEAAGRRIRVLGPGVDVIKRRVEGRGPMEPLFPHPSPGRGRGHAKDADGNLLIVPWSPASFARHYWPKIIDAAGLTAKAYDPYSLRHTHVLLCDQAGLTMPEIQRRIGHESIQTTIDVYGKSIDGMSEESAGRLEALLTPVVRPQIVEGTVVEVDGRTNDATPPPAVA